MGSGWEKLGEYLLSASFPGTSPAHLACERVLDLLDDPVDDRGPVPQEIVDSLRGEV